VARLALRYSQTCSPSTTCTPCASCARRTPAWMARRCQALSSKSRRCTWQPARIPPRRTPSSKNDSRCTSGTRRRLGSWRGSMVARLTGSARRIPTCAFSKAWMISPRAGHPAVLAICATEARASSTSTRCAACATIARMLRRCKAWPGTRYCAPSTNRHWRYQPCTVELCPVASRM